MELRLIQLTLANFVFALPSHLVYNFGQLVKEFDLPPCGQFLKNWKFSILQSFKLLRSFSGRKRLASAYTAKQHNLIELSILIEKRRS